jgi:hypothetical protein
VRLRDKGAVQLFTFSRDYRRKPPKAAAAATASSSTAHRRPVDPEDSSEDSEDIPLSQLTFSTRKT